MLNNECLPYYNSAYAKGNTFPDVRCVGSNIEGNTEVQKQTYIPADIELMKKAGVEKSTTNGYWLACAFYNSSNYRYYYGILDASIGSLIHCGDRLVEILVLLATLVTRE